MHPMSRTLALILLFSATTALADDVKTNKELQRDVNQQERIEQGMQSGELNTKEASRLERQESRVNSMEAKAASDGKVSNTEAARIHRAQSQVSHDIYSEKHDAQTGNPDSASSQRMQKDVARNINQEKRIQQGVQSGSLTEKEAANLQAGQARNDRREARAGADGHVSALDQQRVDTSEDHQSRKIHRKKNNPRTDKTSQ